MKYTFITDYKNNDILRKSLDELAEKTFGINFREWYSNGFWGDKYIPYSVVHDEKVIANVSVNLMDFDMEGTKKHYIQIGTVMTEEAYGGQGLSRYLMEKIMEKYKNKVDGIYLFGNDSVVNFYPKFGFVKSREYQYSKNIYTISNVKKIEHVNMRDKTNWEKLFNTVKNSASNDRFNMDNLGLVAFYTTGFMSDSVYYLAEEDTYIIAEVKEGCLCIYQIISSHKIALEKVISSFGGEITKVTLGFTPYDENGYTIEEFHKEDCTLFIMGKDLENIQKKKLILPALSHA